MSLKNLIAHNDSKRAREAVWMWLTPATERWNSFRNPLVKLPPFFSPLSPVHLSRLFCDINLLTAGISFKLGRLPWLFRVHPPSWLSFWNDFHSISTNQKVVSGNDWRMTKKEPMAIFRSPANGKDEINNGCRIFSLSPRAFRARPRPLSSAYQAGYLQKNYKFN